MQENLNALESVVYGHLDIMGWPHHFQAWMNNIRASYDFN